MAEKELYDYLDTVVPDKDQTLTLEGQGGPILENISKVDFRHDSVDGKSATTINMSGTSIMGTLIIPYNNLTASDRGTLMQFFCDSDYGNGRTNSFKLSYSDGHTYVVQFESMFKCTWHNGRLYSIPVVFNVLGRIAD